MEEGRRDRELRKVERQADRQADGARIKSEKKLERKT